MISFNGNRVSPPILDVRSVDFSSQLTDERQDRLVNDRAFFVLHKIDNAIFNATVNYFRLIAAEWCNLPLTTLMISSPGEIYAGKTLDYTTDALPVSLNWFSQDRNIFLAESSQFYLEMRLLIDGIDKVFSIYNSFRKEKADFSHLAEFQHIEFEGKVDFEENLEILLGLIRFITEYVVKNEEKELRYFLNDEEIGLLVSSFDKERVIRMSFKEALRLLFEATKDEKYKEFSLKNFGAWEEIKLTELVGGHVLVTEYPMLQIPFYHNVVTHDENGVSIAENADLILYGYREAIGSGTRISNIDALKQKAKIFNLPVEDYSPYLKTREYSHYTKTSGFGMGWQRYVHWLLKLPFIWEATHIPRGELLPKP